MKSYFAILHILYIVLCLCAHGSYGLLHDNYLLYLLSVIRTKFNEDLKQAIK